MRPGVLASLHPFVKLKAQRFLTICNERGVDVLVFSTRRTREEQAARYAIGRTVPGPMSNAHDLLGKTVTPDEPGRSLHELGLAFDACPLLAGIPLSFSRSIGEWRLWAIMGEVAQDARVNLQWGGRELKPQGVRRVWHFYYTAGLTVDELLAGSELPPIPRGY
jgi:peptidoglycan L-alanyl-D-glutamate endopeptidase CwlK